MLSSLYFDDDPKVAEAPQQALGEVGFVSVDEVAAPEVVVLDTVAEHEVRGREHRGCDRDDGFLGPAPIFHAQELCLEIAALFPGRGPRALDEGRLQPGGCVTNPGRAAFPGTLIETGTESRPRDQMACAGKPRHVDAEFG